MPPRGHGCECPSGAEDCSQCLKGVRREPVRSVGLFLAEAKSVTKHGRSSGMMLKWFESRAGSSSEGGRRLTVHIVHSGQTYGGGGIHLNYVARAVAQTHDVRVFRSPPQPLPRRPTILAATRLSTTLWRPDVWILPVIPLAAVGAAAGRKGVVGLFYHHDPPTQKGDWLDHVIEKRLWDGLRSARRVVVIAEYWRRYLLDRGVTNPVVIHTPFEVERYRVSAADIEAFRVKYGLTKRPLVYLGNCRPHKGTEEAWAALRDLDYGFVTSGRRALSLPVPNIDGSIHDYVLLLAASDVVLTMSTFAEGWNRTAHEAMLVGTPVIGSGRGGMRELLEAGGQLICERFEDLRHLIPQVIEERAARGDAGQRYAMQFTFARFATQWMDLLAACCPGSKGR